MNGLNLVTCENCGWVHMGVSLGHAFGEAKRFVEWYDEQPPETQENYGEVSYPKLMTSYMHCRVCDAFCTNLREFEEGDCPNGATISPIVAHGQLVYDEAEKDELLTDDNLLRRAGDLILDAVDHEELTPLVESSFRYWLKDYAKPDEGR